MFLEGKMNDSESILQAQKPTRWSTLRGGELGKTDFDRFSFFDLVHEKIFENFFLPTCSRSHRFLKLFLFLPDTYCGEN